MRPIPTRHKKIINEDPYFQVCARKGADCNGRMTIEHALYYAGRQLSEMWAYVPLCWYHHLGKGLNKEMNKYLAMRQMTSEDIGNAYVDYPKFDWIAVRDRLLKKYGRSD